MKIETKIAKVVKRLQDRDLPKLKEAELLSEAYQNVENYIENITFNSDDQRLIDAYERILHTIRCKFGGVPERAARYRERFESDYYESRAKEIVSKDYE